MAGRMGGIYDLVSCHHVCASAVHGITRETEIAMMTIGLLSLAAAYLFCAFCAWEFCRQAFWPRKTCTPTRRDNLLAILPALVWPLTLLTLLLLTAIPGISKQSS